jgi:hypothetical protein
MVVGKDICRTGSLFKNEDPFYTLFIFLMGYTQVL